MYALALSLISDAAVLHFKGNAAASPIALAAPSFAACIKPAHPYVWHPHLKRLGAHHMIKGGLKQPATIHGKAWKCRSIRHVSACCTWNCCETSASTGVTDLIGAKCWHDSEYEDILSSRSGQLQSNMPGVLWCKPPSLHSMSKLAVHLQTEEGGCRSTWKFHGTILLLLLNQLMETLAQRKVVDKSLPGRFRKPWVSQACYLGSACGIRADVSQVVLCSFPGACV